MTNKEECKAIREFLINNKQLWHVDYYNDKRKNGRRRIFKFRNRSFKASVVQSIIRSLNHKGIKGWKVWQDPFHPYTPIGLVKYED